MHKRINLIYILAIAIPLLIVFRQILLGNQLAWGDAPHFNTQELNELISEPHAWTSRGENFGGVNKFIFIWPIMLTFGLLGKVGLESNFISRILFYLPSLGFSILGIFLISKKLGFKTKSKFIATLLYIFNTYYILLIDGGQAGVALAYGLFPLFIYFALNYLDKSNIKNFSLATLFGLLLTISDPRISLLAFLFLGIYKFKRLPKLFLLGMSLVSLSLYWIIPLVKITSNYSSLFSKDSVSIKLINAITLYQPHWPENVFGVVTATPIYFYFIPVLVLISFLITKDKGKNLVFYFMYSIFTLLILGILGIEKIPYGFAFRDSTKFFVPLILTTSIIFGLLVQNIKHKLLLIVIYSYLLLLIAPAFIGKMNFVLSSRKQSKDFQLIANNINSESDFSRSAWFPERHPQANETILHPALDAKDLVDFIPLSNLNVGSYDHFNYLNNKKYLDWYKLLGIKYLVLSGDQRNVDFSKEQVEENQHLEDLVATSSGLTSKNWTNDVKIYDAGEIYPHIYGVDKLYGVVGEVPEILKNKIPAMMFFEDGVVDPNILSTIPITPESFGVVLNGKEKIDLQMSFLQDDFLSNNQIIKNEWSYYPSSERLLWKYQLLIRNIETTEFDYSRGIYLSTNNNEKIEFKKNVDPDGKYILAVRSTGTIDSVLEIKIGDYKLETSPQATGQFYWFTHVVELVKGDQEVVVSNVNGENVLNVVALIPIADWDKSEKITDSLSGYIVDSVDLSSKIVPVEVESPTTVRYELNMPESANWIIFTDKYHPDWKLVRRDKESGSIPLYSMLNGFYLDPSWDSATLVFTGQEDVRWGIYWSVVGLFSLLSILLYIHFRNNGSQK